MSKILCLFLLATLSTGYALRCFSCNSGRNHCTENSVDGVGVETCGRVTGQYRSSCIIKTFRDRNTGSQNVTRQCVLTPTNTQGQDYHCKSSQNFDIHQCRVCDDDLCNGVENPMNPNHTPLAPFPGETSMQGQDFKCYHCDSTTDPYCNEQGSDRMTSITCSRYQSSDYKQGCLKKVVKDYRGTQTVSRQCIFTSIHTQPGFSQNDCQPLSGQTVSDCNVCFSSLCNGPQQSGYTPRPMTLYPSLPTAPTYTTQWRPEPQRPVPGRPVVPPPPSGGALRCYSCDSGLNPLCNDYESERMPYSTCGRSISSSLRSACIKKSFRNTMKGTFNITRQCIFTSVNSQPSSMQDDCRSSPYMEVAECDVCYTDLCNGPSTSGGSSHQRTEPPYAQPYPQQPRPGQPQYGSTITCYSCSNETNRQCNSFWNDADVSKETCQSTDPSFKAACGTQILRDKYNRQVIGKRICLSTGRECYPSDSRYETILCSPCTDNLCNKSPFNTLT